jgi:hypothetical protein
VFQIRSDNPTPLPAQVLTLLLIGGLLLLQFDAQLAKQASNVSQAFIAAVLSMSERTEATASKVGCRRSLGRLGVWLGVGRWP